MEQLTQSDIKGKLIEEQERYIEMSEENKRKYEYFPDNALAKKREEIQALEAQLTPQPIDNPDWGDVIRESQNFISFMDDPDTIKNKDGQFLREEEIKNKTLLALYGNNIIKWIEERKAK